MQRVNRLSVIAILAIVMVLLVACGNQATPSSPPAASAGQPPQASGSSQTPAVAAAPQAPAAPAQPAAKPEQSGELIWLTNTFGNEAWVAGLSAATDDWLSAPIYDLLVYTKPNSDEIMPGLAESWESTPDKKTWTLHLRKGVQFQGGYGELTSADVKFTLETVGGKESVSVAKGYISKRIKSIETPDPYTVVITLDKGDWSLLKVQLGYQNAYTRIMSKKYVEKVGLKEAAKNPIGSGPYKFVSYSPGEALKLEALPSHWRVTPEFKYLTFKLVPEESTRAAMLKSGEADIIDAGPDTTAALEKAGFGLRKVPGGMYEHIILGGMVKPTDAGYDPSIPWFLPKEPDRALKVRKALNLAVDRKAIMDKLFLGQGEPGAVMNFFPTHAAFDPKWTPYPYDPAQAKKLLAEAGFPNGFDMTMYLWIAPGRPELPDLGEIVSGMWEQNLGLKIKRVTADLAMVRDMQVARKTGQAAITGALAYYVEPSDPWNTVSHSSSTAGQFMSAYLDPYIEKAFFEPDDAKRVVATRELGQYLYDNYVDVPIGIKPQYYVVGKKVGDMPLSQGVMFIHNGEYVKQKR